MADKYSTNYFARQEEARRNCSKLMVFFIIAVAGIIAALYFALRSVWYVHMLFQGYDVYDTTGSFANFKLWDPQTFVITAAIVSLIILIAGFYKMNQLRGGGGAVAEMLGGKLISGKTQDLKERQLLNVVEEMSIASGVPVPLVYVLDREKGINAFAAGLTLHDSAIAVTRGALDILTREELQGIIAHEFSHILNGDTRLNVQLIGIIFGILVIGIIGGKILQGAGRIRRSGALIIVLTGLVLLIVGYIGSFMGRLIQSAVSRQKEFLADDSSVQFTRNPAGIISALKKIGGYFKGSKIDSASAQQASHMFFGESHTDFLFSKFLATHPPLIDRVKRLDPNFKGDLPAIKNDAGVSQPFSASVSAFQASAPASQNVAPPEIKPKDIVNLVGNPTGSSLAQSKAILEAIHDKLRETVNTPAGAASAIYALLMGKDCRERGKQLEALHRSIINKGDMNTVLGLCDLIDGLQENQKIPLVELAVPQLRRMSQMETRNFLEILDALIMADGKMTLFEFFIQWTLNQYLVRDKEDLFGKTTFFRMSQVEYDLLMILRALANSGNPGNEGAAESAFKAGVAQIPELAAKNPEFTYTEKINFDLIGSALKQLAYSSFTIKQSVVNACAYCVFADGTVTIEEGELLRAVSLSLHCPLPPFAQSGQVV